MLIRSRMPIIVVETADEARIPSPIGNAAATIGQTMYRWNIAGGLFVGANNSSGAGGGLEPTEVLLNLWNQKPLRLKERKPVRNY